MPRSLGAGGQRAAKAVMSLYRKNYHGSVPATKRLLSIASIPGAVIAERDNLFKNCKVCRTWERSQVQPMARTDIFLGVDGEKGDALHHMTQSVKETRVLHLMEDVSR